MSVKFSDEDFVKLKKILPLYEWGQRILLTNLSIINDDLENFNNINPIKYITSRIKSPSSIARKLNILNLEITAENVINHLKDVAGIRIICSFFKDINYLAELIRTMPNVNVLNEKDYVTSPKPSGYRSYHIIAEVPVFFSGKTENIAVEIQIRTEAMNFWAELEHKARYKYNEYIPQRLCDELVACADKMAELDNRMYLIYEIISLINQDEP